MAVLPGREPGCRRGRAGDIQPCPRVSGSALHRHGPAAAGLRAALEQRGAGCVLPGI